MPTISTVGDLIAALRLHPPESPILATWEGITARVKVISPDGWGVPPGTVLLDVDERCNGDQ